MLRTSKRTGSLLSAMTLLTSRKAPGLFYEPRINIVWGTAPTNSCIWQTKLFQIWQCGDEDIHKTVTENREEEGVILASKAGPLLYEEEERRPPPTECCKSEGGSNKLYVPRGINWKIKVGMWHDIEEFEQENVRLGNELGERCPACWKRDWQLVGTQERPVPPPPLRWAERLLGAGRQPVVLFQQVKQQLIWAGAPSCWIQLQPLPDTRGDTWIFLLNISRSV